MIELFKSKENCCACGACKNICPKKSISMREDEYGFIYPSIDYNLCIECKLCKKVCAYQEKRELQKPKKVLIASARNEEIKLKSASGGIFAALALKILNDGGVVFGASMGESMNVEHIFIESEKEIYKLQGSKYTQSNINDTYKKVQYFLNKGKKVLFSGTPCQVDGLNSFLRKTYENLITVDIICHGVPSNKLFKDYIKTLEKKLNGEVIDFKFRDKARGWELTGKVCYRTNNKIKENTIYCTESSYYNLFLKSVIYRENCYSCKYAQKERPSDLTIGDYWGIREEHPELFKEEKVFNEFTGISAILVNSIKGNDILKESSEYIIFKESSFDKVARHNEQLNKPSCKNSAREEVLNIYKTMGYIGVENRFIKQQGKKLIIKKIFNRLPNSTKKIIRKMK